MALSQRRVQSISYSGRPPERFVAALVATEDQRFHSPFDPGIDPFAIARVILYSLMGHSGDLGGSTIPQQLAKMLYTKGKTGTMTTLEQMTLAIKLKYSYSKEEILSMYADVVYFGHGYYGLVAASCGYFGKAPPGLSWAQAAMLAGVVNAPTADDPRAHPAAARSRESHVLRRLVAVKALTERQAEDALAKPLGLVQTGDSDHCK